ncbi:MAG: 1-acyl-sn-glycerol-3-phosphate acyltransferase [Spirochaetales bacterium]|nr:1-acyl-sn-glycerol-3-phosphate acyltransferase [Spirochaetales bacterium]
MAPSYYNKPFSPDLIAGFLRALWRIPAALFFILFSFMWFIPLNNLTPVPKRGGQRKRFQRFLMSRLVRILGVRIIRRGTCPEGQIFFIANHLGVIDVFTVMAETGARLVAKESLSRIPLFGSLMKRIGVIFIQRSSISDMHRVSEEMSRALAQGDSLAFFPEGTTSRGQGIREFLGALFLPALGAGLPVHYGAIRFHVPSSRWPMASVSACQVGGAGFIKHMALLTFLPRVEVHITYGETPVSASGRKALVRELEDRMTALFEPMEQLPPQELERLFPPVAEESRSLKARPFLPGKN